MLALYLEFIFFSLITRKRVGETIIDEMSFIEYNMGKNSRMVVTVFYFRMATEQLRFKRVCSP